MPAALTHYIFANNLVKNEKYKDIFLLACQGPDPLFFYGYNIAKRENKKEISNIGFYLHGIDPSELYFNLLSYAFNKKGEEKELLVEFTRGFMYHYALDRNVHPYVFYNTGFPYTNKKYNLSHGFFEGSLDTAIKNEYGYKISNRKAIKANKKYIKICSKMLAEVTNKLINKEVLKEDSYFKAYKDLRLVRLIVDSRWGMKKALFNKFLHNSPINTQSQPAKIKDGIDYMNYNKSEWMNPTSGIKSNESVKELFKRAEEDTRIIDTIIYNFKENIVTRRKLDKFTNMINHDGKPLNSNMRYFNLIYKK